VYDPDLDLDAWDAFLSSRLSDEEQDDAGLCRLAWAAWLAERWPAAYAPPLTDPPPSLALTRAGRVRLLAEREAAGQRLWCGADLIHTPPAGIGRVGGESPGGRAGTLYERGLAASRGCDLDLLAKVQAAEEALRRAGEERLRRGRAVGRGYAHYQDDDGTPAAGVRWEAGGEDGGGEGGREYRLEYDYPAPLHHLDLASDSYAWVPPRRHPDLKVRLPREVKTMTFSELMPPPANHAAPDAEPAAPADPDPGDCVADDPAAEDVPGEPPIRRRKDGTPARKPGPRPKAERDHDGQVKEAAQELERAQAERERQERKRRAERERARRRRAKAKRQAGLAGATPARARARTAVPARLRDAVVALAAQHTLPALEAAVAEARTTAMRMLGIDAGDGSADAPARSSRTRGA
jgi:hypothetical protein